MSWWLPFHLLQLVLLTLVGVAGTSVAGSSGWRPRSVMFPKAAVALGCRCLAAVTIKTAIVVAQGRAVAGMGR